MTQITDCLNINHARATLDGMQLALEFSHVFTVIRILGPCTQHYLAAVYNLRDFFDKYFVEFLIHTREWI